MAKKATGASKAAESDSKRTLLLSCPFSEGALTIRELRQDDVKAVKEICFNHFRSTGLAAARYYVVAHIQDMCFLSLLAFLFMSFSRFMLSVLLFHVYLFGKSRWELEQYVRHDCDDIRTAFETYMENGAESRFWVAELCLAASGGSSKKVIAGCVGLVPDKEARTVGKLVRLIVDSQHRRMKIGSRLLMQVEQYASDIGFTDMRIFTNSLNPTHVKFVRQHGYMIAQTVRRGLMRGDLMTWHKRLPGAAVTDKEDLSGSNGAQPCLDSHIAEDKEDGPSEFNHLMITSAASHVMD